MKLLVKKGKTSKLVQIFVQDSSSTTGAGLTGLTSGSTGLVCYRARQDDGNAGATQLALSAGTRGTWSSGGIVEKDASNMPGVYELGLDNAGLATGADQVIYMLKGATNMAPLPIEVQLVDFDPQDSVRLGLTALPNAAANGVSGLPVLDANSLVDVDVKRWLATAVTAAAAGVPDVNAKAINNVSAASVTTISANLGSIQALTFDANNFLKVDLVDIAGVAVATGTAQLGVNVVNIAGAAAALDAGNFLKVDVEDWKGAAAAAMTGDAFARLGAPAGASVSADIAAIKSDTGTGGFIYTRIGAPAGASVSADVAAIKGDTGTILTDVNTGGGAIYTRIGAPAGASIAADVAALKADLDAGVTVAAVAAGATNIKKNAALNNFKFVMTDATTHAPKTALTVAATRDIDNGGFAACTNAVTEIANGWYIINLAAADMNGNVIALRFTATGGDDANFEIVTQP